MMMMMLVLGDEANVLELSSCFAFDEVEPEWAVLPSSRCGCSIMPPLACHFMSCWHRFFSYASLNYVPLQSVIATRDFLRNCWTVALRGAEWSCRRCTVVHISWQWLLDSLSSACVSVFVCRPDQCCVGLTAVDLCVFVAVDPSNVTMKLMLHQKSLHSIWSARGRSDCWRENVCSCCPPV